MTRLMNRMTDSRPVVRVSALALAAALLGVMLPGIGLSLCLGAVVVAGWLALCWKYPFSALCAVAVIGMCQGIVKQVFNWNPAVYAGLDIPWVLFLGMWFVRRVKTRTRLSFGIIDALLLLFFAWSAVEVLNPELPSQFMAIGALRNRLLPMLFFWVGKDLLSPARSQRLLLICLLVAGFGGLVGLYEWSLGSAGIAKLGPGFVPRTSLAWRDETGQGHLRPLSIYQDAGLAALFSALMACLAFNIGETCTGRLKLCVIASGLLCAAFVAVSGVRAAVLCGAVGLLVTVALNYRKFLRPALVLGTALILVSRLVTPQMGARYQGLTDPFAAYQQNRGQTLTSTTQILQETPLGVGTGSATTSASMYVTLFDPGTRVQVRTNDNAFAVLVAEGGAPLALLYLLILGSVLVMAWKARISAAQCRLLAPSLAIFCTIVIMFSFTNMVIDWQPTNLLFWLLTGSLAVSERSL